MSLFSFGSKNSSDLTAEEFKSKMEQDQNAVLIDVRTSDEFASGSIGQAKNIDFFAPDFQSNMLTLAKDKNYYLYCKSGMRSGKGTSFLSKNGYTAYNLKGGISSWPY